MYKSEVPVGNGLSARIHQLNGNSSSGTGNGGLSSKRRSQSFLSRSPASASASLGLLTDTGGTTTHNNNKPFSYINGNNDYNRHNHIPSNYYSLDRRPRPTTTHQTSNATANTGTAPIIYSQVLPKDQRPKKTTTNHHHSASTMTTTIGDDRHIHHYVYENPNKENRTKLKSQSHLNHDLHSNRPTRPTTTTQYRSNGNVTKVFINGDSGLNNYSGTDEQDDDILTPFSKRFSPMPRTSTSNTTNGFHSYNGSGRDLNSSGNTTTKSASYYNSNSTSNGYNNDYMNMDRGNNFDSSLASSSREASPSPPYFSQNHSRDARYEARASNLVRDAERQREMEYSVPSAKLVRTYMFHQNGNRNVNHNDVEDDDISDPIPLNNDRQRQTLYQQEDGTDFIVQNRTRRTNNGKTSSRLNENGTGLSSYKYSSYMDDQDNDRDRDNGYNYDKRNTLRSNGNIQSGGKYGENLTSTTHTRSLHQSSPQIGNQNRGVLKTSTIRKLTTPSSNGNGYRAKSEGLLVPERRQTSTLKSNAQAQLPKSQPSSGNNFLSTLMRSKKNKSTMNVAKENGNVNSSQLRPEIRKPPSGTKHRGNILAIWLRKATSSKDGKDKAKGKPNMNGQTLKKASSIPKIITDSEIEEVERRRDSGAYYPLSSDYYWNKKDNGGYQYDDMSDYRRELATTSKPVQSMTNTNSMRKSVTLGRPPTKGSGAANTRSHFESSSYYPTSAMSLDRRLLNKKAPKIVVTDDSGEPYLNDSNKGKPAGRSMSFFSLRPKTQSNQNTAVGQGQGPTEGNKKAWNFGFMNKSKRSNIPSKSMGNRDGETSFRYFGDTDVEDLPKRNRNILRANPEMRSRKITYSEDDDASRISKSNGNGMYLNATNGSSSNASPYFEKRDGTLRTSASQSHNKYNAPLLNGTSSATESEVELHMGLSQKSSNGATVFLHAATIAEIPPASPLPLHERAMSRDELSTIHSGTGSQIETHKLSRSVSVLAPWRPKHREGSEINYNSSDGMRSDYSKKPPRPYSLANRSNSSTSISPTDYGKGRNSSGYSDWKKPRNGSVNSSDSLRLPKHHSHRTSSPSLLLPPPPSGPKRIRQAPQPSTGQNQKSVTLTRSKSMIDSTGDRNPRNKSGWSPFKRSRP